MSKITSLRFVIKALLAITFLGALVIIVFALRYLISSPISNVEGAWAVVAAALAVIASVVIAWTGQRVLELQQDAQQPYPYPTIDATSRYSVLQLCVRNFGGTPAYDICLEWNNSKLLLNSDSEAVVFTKQEGVPGIPVLLPGENALVPIDEVTRFFNKIEEDANYSGFISCKDASGNSKKYGFVLSVERHRHSLHYEDEEPKTHYRIQEIPKKLDKLTGELRKLERNNRENTS